MTYVKDLAERVLATMAEAAGAAILATGAGTAWSVDWQLVAGVAALAGVLALLKGLAARNVASKETAGLV
jgi:hypothetical protein